MADGLGLNENYNPFPVSGSLGLTTPSLTAGSVPSASAPEEPAVRRRGRDPLSVIGFALSSVAAGLQGRALPKDPTAGDEDLELKRLSTGLAYANKAAEILDNTPPERHGEVVNQFVKASGGVFGPEFGPLLGEIAKSKDVRQVLRALPPELSKTFMEMAGNNPKVALDMAKDDGMRKTLLERAHAINSAEIKTTYDAVAQKLAELPPEAQAKLPRDESGKLRLTTAEFAALGRQHGFLSDSQIYTLNSNPEAFAGFLVPPSVSKAGQEARIEGDKQIRVAGAKAGIENAQPSDLKKKLMEAGLKPGTEEFARQMIANLNRPAASIEFSAERSEQAAYGQTLVKEYEAIRDKAASAQDAVNQLQVARSIPVTGGALEPLRAKAGAIAESLGVPKSMLADLGIAQATNAQAFTGIMQNLVLTKMQAQKGPQTENDAKRIEATVANLGNTDDARDFLMRSATALARRDIDQRGFYEEWKAEKGTFEGSARAWREHVNQTPLLGINPTSKLPVFYDEFATAVKAANPKMTREQILAAWREKYGG